MQTHFVVLNRNRDYEIKTRDTHCEIQHRVKMKRLASYPKEKFFTLF